MMIIQKWGRKTKRGGEDGVSDNLSLMFNWVIGISWS